jgi:hypothetical protein
VLLLQVPPADLPPANTGHPDILVLIQRYLFVLIQKDKDIFLSVYPVGQSLACDPVGQSLACDPVGQSLACDPVGQSLACDPVGQSLACDIPKIFLQFTIDT